MQTQLQQLKTYLKKYLLQVVSLFFIASLPLFIGEIIANSHAYLLGKYINYLHIRITLTLILALVVCVAYILQKKPQKDLIIFLSISALAPLVTSQPIYGLSREIGAPFFPLYIASIFHLTAFFTTAGAFFIATKTILTSEAFLHKSFFKVISISLVFQLIFGIFQYFSNGPFAPSYLAWLGQPTEFTSKSIIGIFEYTRLYGTTPHPNILAGIIVFLNFLVLSLEVPKKNKLLFGIASIVLLVGTLSKTGILAFIALIFVYLLRIQLEKITLPKLLYWAIPLLLTIAVGATALFPETSATFVDSRVMIQSLYLELLQKFPHFLLTGTGFTMSIQTLLFHAKDITQTVIWGNQILAEPPHNILLLMLVELGLPLTTVLVGGLWVIWKQNWQSLYKWQYIALVLIVLILGSFDHYLVY
jgi:O-antigen ligase